MKTFNFNVTFTREDENHANIYTVGYNAYGVGIDTVEAAEAQVRRRTAHLAVTEVKLMAVMDEDGTVTEQAVL